MCAYRDLAAIVVDIGFAAVTAVIHRFPVIADGQGQGIRHRFPLHQLEHQRIHHLPDNDPCFLAGVGAGQHLPFTKAVEHRAVLLDVLYCAGFYSKCVVDQNFSVNAEGLIEPLFLGKGGTGQLAHGADVVPLQPRGSARTDAPEVCQGPVIPQQVAKGCFVQLRNADAVRVGRHLLGGDIQCHFGEIEIGTDTGGCCDARLIQHLPDHGFHQLPGGHVVGLQVRRQIRENLINGIDMDVLFGEEPQIDGVDF